jgi:hypothetical protein
MSQKQIKSDVLQRVRKMQNVRRQRNKRKSSKKKAPQTKTREKILSPVRPDLILVLLNTAITTTMCLHTSQKQKKAKIMEIKAAPQVQQV